MKIAALWRRVMNAASVYLRPNEPRVFMSQRQAGVTVTEDTALTLAEWWACVSVISRTVAALPWRVYERTSDGRRSIDNAVAWLLNSQPNPEMTAFSFREALMAHVLNWGNGYAEIQRDASGRPVALWLMTPDRVSLERDESGALAYVVTDDDGRQTPLPPSSVFHVHGLGFDGLVGYSPVRMAARSIGLGIAQDTFAGSFYANGAIIGTVVEIGANMNAEQVKAAESYYNDRHGGPQSAFRVKVAPNGTKVHAMGMPLSDAQFVESRQFTVTMAARWLGVPPHKIADLTRSTNNNIEHQGIEFVTDAIVPWAKRLEQEADVKLFGIRAQGRVYTKLSVNALMRGDSKARAEFYRAMVSMGAMSINEVRELEELNAIGSVGDAHLVQVNQTTLERLVEGQPEPEPQPEEPDDVEAGDDAEDAAEGDSEDASEPAPPRPNNVYDLADAVRGRSLRREALDYIRQQQQGTA